MHHTNRRLGGSVGLLCLLVLVALGATRSSSSAEESPALVQQGPKLTGGEEAGGGRFGRSVALSADGDTALIGGPRDDGEVGAAWVDVRSGSTWTQQAKLTGAGEVGEGHFGRSVALSADGDTAVVGAPNDSGGLGAVWVFTRTGSTWAEQARLTGAGESGKGWFGRSVAISGDGDTILVGGFVDHSDVGAAWVFTRTDSTWAQQGGKLTGAEESSEGEFGWSVALSADGDTALIGGHEDGGDVGAAWVFARSGATWAQQGGKLTGAEESGPGEFGEDVALSADGDTALVGGQSDDGVGAAWVFARSGSTWAQQGGKLTGGEESGAGYFGDAVALSADGDTALVGGFKDGAGVGAAWLFTRSGSTWAQRGPKLTGGEAQGKGQFGWGVALSAEADTALIGGLADGGDVGAAWVFVTAPPPAPPAGGEPPPSGPTPPEAHTPAQGATGGSSHAGTTPRQGVAAYRAASGVVLVGRRLPVRRGRARVTLRCTAPVACRGRLTLAITARTGAAGRWRSVALARGGFSIRRGRTVTLWLTLRAGTRARLSAHGRLRAALAVLVTAPDPPATRTYVVEVVRRGAPRRRAVR